MALPILALAYLPYLYFALAFNVPDPDFSAFFIPLHLLAAALMGGGLTSLITALDRLAPSHTRSRPGLAAAGALTLFALLPLRAIWTTYPRVDQSGDWARHQLGELMLAQPLAPGAAILADSQKIAPLYYLQVAEGVRPDLDILVLPDEASYYAALDARLAAGQPVYLGRYLPGLGAGYSLRSLGPLAEVSPMPFGTSPVPLLPPASQPAAPGIHLVGYALGPAGLRGAPPQSVPLTLAWQAPATPGNHWLVYLRLVDPAGRPAWQSAGTVPVGGLYPTNAWRPGEVVTDFHLVPLAETLPPDTYQLQAGLFPPFAPGDTGWAVVAPLTILPAGAPPSPSGLVRARLGNHWLLGYDLPESAAPGAPVPLTLFWRRSPGVATVTAFGETRSLATWPEGAIAPLAYRLAAPVDAALVVTVSTGAPARCGWLRPVTAACALPPVAVVGPASLENAVNFAGRVLLRQAQVLTEAAAPGGQVRVALEWQALQRLTEDYTVFVHLLGPDGLVHGQIDAWPVSGTRATSTWTPGEVISDPYTIPVAAGAPPGEYHVEVGLYLLATGERLAVLNADGLPVDDRLLLAGLTIHD
jgi:hypothetical protein